MGSSYPSNRQLNDGLPEFLIADDDEQENDLPIGDGHDFSDVEPGIPDFSKVEAGITNAATLLDRATES